MTATNGSAAPDVLRKALAYLDAGLSVLPIARDGSKAPDWTRLPRVQGDDGIFHATWDPLKEHLPARDEVERMFRGCRPPGVAIIGGPVSGNLLVLDFEFLDFFEDWRELVEAEAPGLTARLPTVGTPGKDPKGGRHVYARKAGAPAPTGKLARISREEAERRTGEPGKTTAVEAKGKGGYVLTVGCPAECHESGRVYRHVSGPPVTEPPTLTDAEVEVMLACARSLTRVPSAEASDGAAGARRRGAGGLSTGDDFNVRGPDWAEILEPHGWTCVRKRNDVRHWRRPGKDGPGWSATAGYCRSEKGGDLLAVFSTNAHPFEGATSERDCQCYSKFAAFALLEHRGDFKEAAKALSKKGYGEQSQEREGKHEAPASPEPPQSADWPSTPLPIRVDLLPVPKLDPRLIPGPFRDWLKDIARRGCFPLEYPTGAAVVGVSSVVGRQVGIRPKRRDDWLVVPNVWGGVVGPPGIQKSPAVLEALRPLRRLGADALKAHEQVVRECEVDDLVARAKADAAKDNLKKAAKAGKASDDDLRKIAQEAEPPAGGKRPPLKRFETNDPTVEKLGELLAENPNGLLLFRDELIGFLRNLDREGHESDRGFYLESWNGTGPYIYDRIGRGTIVIPNVCLSLFGTIQPGPLARYLRTAATGDNDGLMNRFQVLLYPDPPATWSNVDEYPDTEAKNIAYKVFQDLAALDANETGAETDDEGGIPFLRFAEDAQELFDHWRTELETRLRSGSESPVMECHLSKYRSLMPSLALLFHLIEVQGGRASGPVSLRSAEAAAAWCELLEAHARRLYQAAFEGDPEPATRLGERIRSGCLPNPFRARDVVRKCWSGLDTESAVERALLLLEDRHWVMARQVPPGERGGRPTVDYWIHPELLPRGAADDTGA
jgi:putative DNA primase/helicase